MSTKIDGDSVHVQTLFRKITITTNSNASNQTYTAAQVLGGAINRDPNGAARTDTTPTAAQIVSEMTSKNSAVEAGSSFRFFLANTSSSYEITLAAGTGVTLTGETTIKKDKAVEIGVIATNVTASSEAVTMYILTNTENV